MFFCVANIMILKLKFLKMYNLLQFKFDFEFVFLKRIHEKSIKSHP